VAIPLSEETTIKYSMTLFGNQNQQIKETYGHSKKSQAV